jgi:superoxide dismutase, Fe-Mn family
MATTRRSQKLLDGIDVEGLIAASLTKSLQPALDEAYVAEPKPYSQVTEFLSQKTKDAHASLYKGYVETLNRVSAELDTAERAKADSKHSEFHSLKLDETFNLNATWLHELYFAGSFDVHSEIYMDSVTFIELERTFGTFDDWQKDFLACALACGQGWAICGYNMFLKRFVNTIITGHSQDAMLGLFPIVCLDCHEHAYYRDYLTDRKSYIIAMLQQINWEVVEERVKKAKSIAEILK